jgi:hypothetical protein
MDVRGERVAALRNFVTRAALSFSPSPRSRPREPPLLGQLVRFFSPRRIVPSQGDCSYRCIRPNVVRPIPPVVPLRGKEAGSDLIAALHATL